MIDDAARRVELSRNLGLPVLKPPPRCQKHVDSPGSCSTIWIYDDGATVLKTSLAFYLDGCDSRQKKEHEDLEQESAALLEREKRIYRHLGRHPGILHCIDISDAGLKFPYMKNGSLRSFLCNANVQIPPSVQLSWIKTALVTFDFIHSKGVIQSDVSARNFLVTDDKSIVLCDFAGSMIGDEENLVRPETRYEKQCERPVKISLPTELFAIGSLIYEIITGKPPYSELEDNDVERLFRRGEFPSTSDIYLGYVIRRCWKGEFETAREVLNAVNS